MNSPVLRILFALVNAAGLPGVGTVLAGRTRTGWTQIGLSLLFLLLTLLPLIAMGSEMVSRGMNFARLVDVFLLRDSWIFSQKEITLLLFTIGGMFAYMGNLLWSLTTTGPVFKNVPPPLPPSIH